MGLSKVYDFLRLGKFINKEKLSINKVEVGLNGVYNLQGLSIGLDTEKNYLVFSLNGKSNNRIILPLVKNDSSLEVGEVLIENKDKNATIKLAKDGKITLNATTFVVNSEAIKLGSSGASFTPLVKEDVTSGAFTTKVQGADIPLTLNPVPIALKVQKVNIQ